MTFYRGTHSFISSRDTVIEVEVEVNPSFQPVGYGATKVAGPAGAELAYRWRESRGSVTEETALTLIGRWQAAGDTADMVPLAGAAPTVEQAVSIRVTADESRIDSVLDAIDLRALAGLVAPDTGR